MAFTRIDLKTAIIYVHNAWGKVKAKTIANCFVHSNILGDSKNTEFRRQRSNFSNMDISMDENQLAQFIERMSIRDSLTMEEYVEIINENGNIL